MKTIDEILDASRQPADIINDLMTKTISVPSWDDLRKQYDSKEHPVYKDANYTDNPDKKIKLSRIALGWNKLATKRMSEMCFGIPVKRVYTPQDDDEQTAARILESIYAKNHIDTVNIARARALYASCEFATIWYSQLGDAVYGGEPSILKLRCKTYSPLTGEQIYPLFDDFDDLIALSVKYSRTINNETIQYFETYTDSMHIRWMSNGNVWVEDGSRESIAIGKIAGVYGHRPEPIWEGESENVYEAEWTLSRNGNYIRKNSKPNWVVRCDKDELEQFASEQDSDTTSRNVLYYPKDATVGFETWSQSTESIKFQIDMIRQNYFMQLQLPDMSFDTMKSTPMSGEARKMMFIDAQLKVLDESGPWKETLERECNVIKAYTKKMYPALESAFETLEIEHVITPYQISDEMENAQIASQMTGGKQIISQRTAMQRYADITDVDEELKQISIESAASLEELAY